MNRVMIWATALLLMVACMTVSQEANAGLFNRKSDCCKPAKCPKQKKCRDGLFAKRKAKKDCCEPTCCEAAPVCAAPVVTCGCEAPVVSSCGCEAAPVASCGCEAPVASTCGCEAPVNCDCLSGRKLRRANRKGQCCGVEAKTCGGCSAPVSTCGCSAPVAAAPCGCGSAPVEAAPCGCSGAPVEAAPATETPAEAAPTAPESTT